MRAPSIAIARLHLRRAEAVGDDRARNAGFGRMFAWLGIVPSVGTAQRVAWERERGADGFSNRRARRLWRDRAIRFVGR